MTQATLRALDEPPPRTVIRHAGGRHVFRRDAMGAWTCGCDPLGGWTWPNVVTYVNERGPVEVIQPGELGGGR